MPPVPVPTDQGVKPRIVGLVRAILIAVITAGLAGLVAALNALTNGGLAGIVPDAWLPVVALLLPMLARAIEGIIDDLRGQAPQAGPLGSAPANPIDYIAQGSRHLSAGPELDLATLTPAEAALALDAVAVARRTGAVGT